MWCQRFGTQIAVKIRRDRLAPADKWHLDEAVISIRGRKHWLWRAVDANGDVLEILMQSRRNAHASKRFLMKLMKRWGVPGVLVTDKLRCYGVAVRDLCPSVDHRFHKGLKNRSCVVAIGGCARSPAHVRTGSVLRQQSPDVRINPQAHRAVGKGRRNAVAVAFEADQAGWRHPLAVFDKAIECGGQRQ